MLAIIPARGGSKGLKRKNIRLLNGKPLIYYTVKAALHAKHITQVIVSTDDEQIASYALEYGAKVPFMRPENLATDESYAIDAVIWTLGKLRAPLVAYQEMHNSDQEWVYNEFAMLFPTSPLRTSEDIDNAIELFHEKQADSVISYTESPWPLSYFTGIMPDDSFLPNLFTTNKLLNRQDYPRAYYRNGAIFVFNYEKTVKQRIFSTEKSYAYIMPREKSVDIDSVQDLKYAEYLMRSK